MVSRKLLKISFLCLLSLSSIWVYLLINAEHIFREKPGKENLDRLLALNPFQDRAILFYILKGKDLLTIDQKVKYIKKAIRLNPATSIYWEILGNLLLQQNKKEKALKALERAIFLNPYDTNLRWRVGTIFLTSGNRERAISEYLFLALNYPPLRRASLVVLDQLLETQALLGKIQGSFYAKRDLLFINIKKKEVSAAKLIWKSLSTEGNKLELSDYKSYISFLISSKEFYDAYSEWRNLVSRNEIEITLPSPGDLLVNGDFENDSTCIGFDWCIRSIKGVKVSYDQRVFYSGHRSLQISFDGNENPDFHHVSQIVYIEDPGSYLLTGWIKTKGLTTKNGIEIEIIGMGSKRFRVSSSNYIGTNEWSKFHVPFKMPLEKEAVLIRIRRRKSHKFDKFIGGIAWIDELILSRK